MKKSNLFALVVSLGMMVSYVVPARSAENPDKSVDNAYKLCAVMDRTNLLSEPCSVSGWGSSVNVSMDMSASNARQLCPQIKGMLQTKNITFKDGWTLKISSPYSGEKTIATCPL
ncbi:hypothetical protein [Pseudomonas helleri]|uniref:hypothetical protein n=1 Tax=Pseudomonas helleri TaxID=1608996 RepID=UPI003F992BB2